MQKFIQSLPVKYHLSKSSFGVLLYLSAMLVTVLLNIFVKKAITQFSLPTWEVLCIRQMFIVMGLLPLMVKNKFNFFDKVAFKPNVFRNILFAFSTFLLYTGISRVPLNDATAITFLTPIIGSVLAVKLLKEKPSKTLWVALVLSIIGVVVVKKPGFNNPELLIGYGALLVTTIIRGYIVVLNKRLSNQFDTMTMLFYTHIVMFLVALCFCKQFVPVPFGAFKYLAGAALLFFIEYYLIFKAYKYCTASNLQPLEFTRLIYMMVLSALLMGEMVNLNQVVGGVIILSGFAVMLVGKRKKNALVEQQ